MKQLRLFISGIVQGVCFRFFIQEKAEVLGLAGFVRNMADGRVEVLAEGREEDLKIMENFAQQGPPAAKVENVEKSWGTAENKWKGFEIYG